MYARNSEELELLAASRSYLTLRGPEGDRAWFKERFAVFINTLYKA